MGVIFVGVGGDAGISNAIWQVGRSVIGVAASAGAVDQVLAIAQTMVRRPPNR